jgi:saccharopine dehydrogenase-like NADP-dependent oxidoreductase
MNKKLLILGGYGNTGRLIAELMLQETDVRVILAGVLPHFNKLGRTPPCKTV